MKCWIAVASREHVLGGVSGKFCQVCHGKPGPLRQMEKGDWLAYYSPTELFGQTSPCRKFTALGRISEGEPYTFRMSEDFVPWRRDVAFLEANEAAIEPLIDQLSFIKDKRRWGFPFRWGCFQIPFGDMRLIASKMGIAIGQS